MDLAKIKLPIGIVVLVIAQAFGIIYWVAGQDDAVGDLQSQVTDIEDSIEELGDEIEELSKTQAIITNEYRTIMSDHMGFSATLKEMGQSGALPSGERRAYGGY
tara:strand:+ start:396 stop:707 length:312 start_codon:yes stop_codon:yes gene_type:complete